jgi:hypothetical protein
VAELVLALLPGMRVKELKELLTKSKVDISDLLEKKELVDKAKGLLS